MSAGRLLALLSALALVAPVAAWIWARPQRGLLVLVALMPFDGLLIIAPLPSAFAAWKEALVALTLLAAFQPGRPRVGRTVPGWLWAMTLLATASLVTWFWTPSFQVAVGMKVAFFGVLPGVAALRCPFEPRDRDRLVSILLTTGCVTAVVGLVQQLMGPARLNALGYDYNTVIRFTGSLMRSWSTFNQPFAFGLFLMVIVLITLASALDDPRRMRSRLTFAALPLLFAAMFFSVVRTAWIGTAVGIAYLAVRRYRKMLRLLPAVAGLAAVAAVVGLFAFFDSASAGDRLSRWRPIPSLVAEAPFGHGAGSAGAAAAKADELHGTATTFTPGRVTSAHLVYQPDNSYVEVLFEDGVIGLALFLVALQLVWRASRRAEADGTDPAEAVGMSAVVLAVVVACMGSTFFEIFPLDYLYWLLAGVTTASAQPRFTPVAAVADESVLVA